MDMYYWTGFSKRENSTKKPTTTGTKVEILLKEDTSIDNPSIVLTGNVLNIDYCYIPDFGKYYFVGSPVILADNMTQYDLVEDCLGTHKTAIGNTVAHIVYSSTGYDKYIVDPRISVKPTKQYQDTQTLASGLSSQGIYILSVVSEDANGETGALAYYFIDYSEIDDLMKDMIADTAWDAIKQKLNDPMESVVDLIWIPLPSSALASGVNIETSASSIKLMKTQLSCQGFQLKNPIVTLSAVSLSIPYRLQDFRDSQPYTSFSLYLPGLGLTDLNADDFIESLNVNIYTYVDIAHGDLTYWIYDDDGNVLKTASFHCGVTVPIAHMATNAGGGITSIGGAVGGFMGFVGGIVSGNPLVAAGGALSSVLAGGNAALQFNSRSTSVKGTDVGRSAFYDTSFTLLETVVDTEDPDDANYIAKWGRPVGETHAINNHSGFVQCENASIEIAGDSFERENINRFLNNGFYYE